MKTFFGPLKRIFGPLEPIVDFLFLERFLDFFKTDFMNFGTKPIFVLFQGFQGFKTLYILFQGFKTDFGFLKSIFGFLKSISGLLESKFEIPKI